MKLIMIFTKSGTFEIDSNGNELHSRNSDCYEVYYDNKGAKITMKEYDDKGNLMYSQDALGFEKWHNYDKNNNRIHCKYSNGFKECYEFEQWWEYDNDCNRIHYKDSKGREFWYDNKGAKITKEDYDSIHNPCAGKTVTIDEKEYTLIPV